MLESKKEDKVYIPDERKEGSPSKVLSDSPVIQHADISSHSPGKGKSLPAFMHSSLG